MIRAKGFSKEDMIFVRLPIDGYRIEVSPKQFSGIKEGTIIWERQTLSIYGSLSSTLLWIDFPFPIFILEYVLWA